MTETASTITFNKSITDRRAYSVGKPIWGTQTQVWDEKLNALPPGNDNVGEVVTRGLDVMKGYLNNPVATAEVFTADGPAFRCLPPVGPGGQLPPVDPRHWHTAEAARRRRLRPLLPVRGHCADGVLAAGTVPASG